MFLSAVPSGLLIAVTAHISTDVAAAPLLWVMPLSLYLLTWVLVFARRPLISHALDAALQPFAIVAIVALLLYSGQLPLLANLAAHLLGVLRHRHGLSRRTRAQPAGGGASDRRFMSRCRSAA